MMSNQKILKFKEKSQKAIEFLKDELSRIRTGRATPSLVEGLKVEVYESKMDLRNLAAISTPESRLIVIQPWDPNIIPNIEKSILSSDLGLTPSTDEQIIRINVPPLTAERRESLIKMVKEKLEGVRVKIRGFRRELIEDFRSMKESGEISEDEQRRLEKELQKEVDLINEEIEKIGNRKQEELQEV